MGQFVAYKRSDDMEAVNIDTSDDVFYYSQILEDALGDYFVPVTIEGSPQIGYVTTKPGTPVSDLNAARRLIANEEGKYYFKWQDDDSEVKDSENRYVLNRLERVDVQRYNYLRDKSVTEHIKDQDASISKNVTDTVVTDSTKSPLNLPLSLELMPGPDEQNREDYEVYVNVNSTALYLDTDVDTKWYKYKLGQNGEYKAGYTWIPKIIKKRPEAAFPEEFEYFKTGLALAGAEESFRYLYYLYLECEELKVKRGLIKVKTGKKWLQERQKLMNNLFKKGYTAIASNLSIFLSTVTDVQHDNAILAAQDASRAIPARYRCFYYSTNERMIDGFLTDVSLGDEGAGEGGRLSRGYEGRADRAFEVDYRWEIVPAPDTDDFYLAKLLSYIIGLDRSKFLGNGDKIPKGFKETNCPFAAKALIDTYRAKQKKPEVAGGAFLFRYYKEFLTTRPRRNKPKDVKDIGEPRILKNLLRKPDENIGLRKWKKGASLDGERRGERAPKRQDAGSVLAKALRKFEFYPNAIGRDTAIKLSRLPATPFAGYIVSSDDRAKKYWNGDNGLNADDNSTVKTDQEWCHLYGHGDGGEETLENFVSGSKHCNTEQLGIEIGQRRVSQNVDIPQISRNLLTWKITADQLPNYGTKASAPDQDLANTIFAQLTKIGSAEKDKQLGRFFESDNSLKSDGKLRLGLEQLAGEISGAKKIAYGGGYSKTERAKAKTMIEVLLNFQREFLINFFLYYPLGRRIHYRIFFNSVKCFEHHFDAQSQSFDVNEAKILDYTVERAIYLAMIKYENEKNSLGITKNNTRISASEYYDKLVLERAIDFSLSKTEQDFVKAIGEEIESVKNDVNNKNIGNSIKSHLTNLKSIWNKPSIVISTRILKKLVAMQTAVNDLDTAIENDKATDMEIVDETDRIVDFGDEFNRVCQSPLHNIKEFTDRSSKRRKK